MAKKLPLKSFRLKNFKAIRDSGVVKFTPLTVLIGDNGSGKSSLIEGLQTYHRLVIDGVDEAMQPWRGYEHVLNSALPADENDGFETELRQDAPMSFAVNHWFPANGSRSRGYNRPHEVSLASKLEDEHIFIVEESWKVGRKKYLRRDDENTTIVMHRTKRGRSFEFPVVLTRTWWPLLPPPHDAEVSEIQDTHINAFSVIRAWQFLMLNPYAMGQPQPQNRTVGAIRLNSDGSNIAEYLSDMLERFPEIFDSILGAMRYVMPYMRGLKPKLTSILGRQMHLEMTEDDFKVMGWLLSQGTLRILALLALFRHPEPPPLIVIEEIENGLDPRAIHLIVEEIRLLVESGRSQVVVTTHSPYLLNLLPLSTIVLVERIDGQPTFRRPADDESLEGWAERFSPGDLYTMGNLHS
ncbi:MAG: ATP-binding protein [Chloroflexi bacterium]|nr:ATP-binding protein [Chloroflexota bacterium]